MIKARDGCSDANQRRARQRGWTRCRGRGARAVRVWSGFGSWCVGGATRGAGRARPRARARRDDDASVARCRECSARRLCSQKGMAISAARAWLCARAALMAVAGTAAAAEARRWPTILRGCEPIVEHQSRAPPSRAAPRAASDRVALEEAVGQRVEARVGRFESVLPEQNMLGDNLDRRRTLRRQQRELEGDGASESACWCHTGPRERAKCGAPGGSGP